MQTLIDDLLAYFRVGSQGAAFVPTDCKEICDHVLENLQAAIASNPASVTPIDSRCSSPTPLSSFSCFRTC